MTIREAQELIRFTDAKNNRLPEKTDLSKEELGQRFRALIQQANDAGLDLTEALADMQDDKKL